MIEFKIAPIILRDIEKIVTQAKKANLTFCNKTQLFGALTSRGIIGFGGVIVCKNKAIIKNLYVVPEYRGQGIFKKLMDYIEKYLKTIDHIQKWEATCTIMSIREFKHRGFFEIKKYKNGCVKVQRENI